MRVEACEATEVRHTQSAALLDLRMTCLDRRRTELATLVGALTDKPDRERISRGAEAALQLSSLASCADGTALVARVAPPEDPVTRVRVDAVESRLASATGLERAGDYKAALAVTQGAAVEAGALGYEPLIADALFRRGRLEGSTGDQKAAEASFGEALRRAAIAHDDRLTAAAWIGLVEVVGFRLARRDEGLTFARAAETSLLRLGGDPLLEAELHEQRGQILRELASYDAAVAEHRHALELRRAALPAGDPRIAQSLHALAEVERIQGKLDVARGDHEAALAARIAALGPDHPLVAISLMNLGHCFFALGQVAEARAHYERALAIDQRALPPDHPEIGNALTSLGAVEETEGKLDAAIARYTEAAAIYRASLGDRSPMLAIVETDLAQAERARKQFPAAQAHFERALAIHLALGKHDHPAVAEVLSSYAEMLYYDLHREADARARYEEASAIFDKIPGVNPALASGPIVGLADLALDAKDPRRAAELLERALAMRAQDSPAQIAWVKYRLAEALWLARPAERVRAHALATEARAAFAADPVNRPALDTWLAAHSL